MDTYIPIFQNLITAIGVITAAVVAAILARRSYVRQKEIDRLEDLRRRRAEEYESYIKTFREVIRHAERLHQQDGEDSQTEWFLGEARAKYDELFTFLFVIASDDVCLRAAALHENLSKNYTLKSIDTEKLRADEGIRDLYTELITAMRRDCFEATKLSRQQINPWLN